MELICVNCGATIADQDPVCTRCGVFRGASLPPGSSDPVTAVVDGPSVVASQQPFPDQAFVYADDPYPAPAVPSIGATDIAITAISVALAFGLGWLVHNNVDDLQSWMVLRSVFGFESAAEFNGHDLLVMLVTFSPLAVAVLGASISRIPGTGLMAAAASFAALVYESNGPRVIGWTPEFNLDRDWVIVVVLAGFAVADLILAFSDRGVLTGLFAGALTGVVGAGYVALYIERINWLDMFDEAWLIVLLLVVPAILLLLAGLVGGAIGGLRRR